MTPQQIEQHIEDNKPEPSKKWELHYGIHRGTLMSRDTGVIERDTLEECRQYVAEEDQWLRSIGYMFWYAYAIEPGSDGKKQITLHPGNSYRSC